MTSVVIPCHKDPMLLDTLNGIADTAKDVEVVIVHDGCPTQSLPEYPFDVVQISTGSQILGTNAARHYGIMRASGDVIITMDAHMKFLKNDWASGFADLVKDEPNTVYCSRCIYVSKKNPDISTAPHEGRGAKVHYINHVKDLNENIPLDPKWCDYVPGEEIGAIMGACYSFSKDWYVSGLKMPWLGGIGWGCDESILSMTNWLCGGKNRLADIKVGHWFSGGSAWSIKNAWINRRRVLEMLPLSGKHYNELLESMRQSRGYSMIENEITHSMIQDMRAGVIKRHLLDQKRTMDDYIKEWVVQNS